MKVRLGVEKTSRSVRIIFPYPSPTVSIVAVNPMSTELANPLGGAGGKGVLQLFWTLSDVDLSKRIECTETLVDRVIQDQVHTW